MSVLLIAVAKYSHGTHYQGFEALLAVFSNKGTVQYIHDPW